MTKPLRTSIGLMLLITTISLASCQSMVNSISNETNLQAKNNQINLATEKFS